MEPYIVPEDREGCRESGSPPVFFEYVLKNKIKSDIIPSLTVKRT